MSFPVGAVLLLAALVAAEAALRLSGLESDTVAAPSAIARAFAEAVADGLLPAATGQTLGAAASGLVLGGGAGLLLAAQRRLFGAAGGLAETRP